jgi:hypothetical protein
VAGLHRRGTALALVLGLFGASLPGRARAEEAMSGEDGPGACSRVHYAPAPADPKLAPNPAGPTLVGLSFVVRDLRGIDPRRDAFEFQGYVRSQWCDPRLAFDPAQAGRSELLLTGAEAERKLASIWMPGAFPVNPVSPLRISERVLRVRSDGTVRHDLNVGVDLVAHYDLRRFPFDHQTLEVQVESFAWDERSVRFAPDAATELSEELTIPEWEIRGISKRVEEVDALRGDAPFSRLVLSIEIARKPGFYLWKIFLPLLIIVAISWSVFWMSDERLAGRSRISATGVLTVVAYQFVIAEDLPRVPYLTLLDQVTLVSFVLLAVTVLESMWVARHQQSDPERGARIDRASRWIFPGVYAGILLVIFGMG